MKNVCLQAASWVTSGTQTCSTENDFSRQWKEALGVPLGLDKAVDKLASHSQSQGAL